MSLRERRPKIAGLSVSAAVLAGFLTVVEHSSVAGPAALLRAITGRFEQRAGITAVPSDNLTLGNPATS